MAKKKEMEIKGGNYTSANTSTTQRVIFIQLPPQMSLRRKIAIFVGEKV